MSRDLSSSWLVSLVLLITMGLFSLSALASDRLVWKGNGHSYQKFENTVNWTEAQTYCESQGGYLATVTSQEEQQFIFSQLGTAGLVWLGGTDAGHEGTWSWVTNEPWNYSNWDGGEPNNGYGNENYLLMNHYGTWNDMSLDNTLWFVCEWNNDQSSNGIILALEEPANGSTYSGIANVRGWAVAPQGVKKIELYIDGALIGNIPLGGKRSDVGAAYPSYPNSVDSGFAMAFNYSEHSTLTAGSHTFTVRAYDPTGGSRDASAIVNVVQFASSYMSDPTAVNVDNATITRGGNTITVQNLLAEGQPYTVQLNWRPAVQGFAITQINRTSAITVGALPDQIHQNTSQTIKETQASSPLTTPMAASDSIVINLEEPTSGSTYSGISNVRGWTVAPQGLQKVELYVDGVLKGNLPLGGLRTDVSHAYPDYPGAAQSGFAMAFNYSGLAAGSHTFTVRAYDNTGGARDVNATISVARFVSSYMVDPVAVNMDSATITQGGNVITVQNLLAEGQPYTVQLNWRPATQGFAITQINSASGGGGGGCSYTINPTSQQFSAQDGSGDVTVTTQPGCSWTAKNNVDWIAIASGANETGSGTVKYLVSSNSGVVLRIGTLTIAGQKFTVYQNHNQGSNDGGQ